MQEQSNETKMQAPQQPPIPIKVSIDLHQPISKFFFYQNHIICQFQQTILVFNALTKQTLTVKIPKKEYLLAQLPPFLFAIFEDRYIHAYRMESGQLEQPVHFRISKLEPRSICRFNKGYFMGGYNRSMLPGNKRTNTRDIYFIQNLDSNQKNRPVLTIRLKDNTNPVSVLQVQNPYLFAYCQPVAYLISISSKNILITFEKQATSLLLLEGRFAMSSANGVGVSKKGNLFTFDVERLPIFGVEITQHRHECDVICMEKTGRIFGGRGIEVFEYNPFRQEKTNIARYAKGEEVQWICCTPSNSLMVLRVKADRTSCLDVFSLE